LQAITKQFNRLKRDKRGVSTVITIMLSLVLIVIIVGNVFLTSYKMNQVDMEKVQESLSLTSVSPATSSPWFTAQNQFNINSGSLINGNYAGTQQLGDSNSETFREEHSLTNASFNPSGYILDGSTTYISGSTSNLTNNDNVNMTFGSYASSFSAQTFYAHKETTNIAGTVYNNSILTSADYTGVTLSSPMTSPRTILDQSVYNLQGTSTIPMSTWTMYYRALKTDANTNIVYDSVSQGNNAGSSASFSWNHNTGSGSNRIMVAGVSILSPSQASVSSISYNGQNLAKIRNDSGLSNTGTINAVPITITNTQSSATPNPFQVMITWNPLAYSTYEASNLGNIRFYSDAGLTTPLYAWLESCTPSLSDTATNATAWIKLTSSIAGSGGSATIYMAFLPTGTDFDGNYWGNAPNLSATYGAQDNGANVFNAYFNGNTATSSFSVNSGYTLAQANGVSGPGGTTINAIRATGYGGHSVFSFNDEMSNTGLIAESSFSSPGSVTPGTDTGAVGIVNNVAASSVNNAISADIGGGNHYFEQDYLTGGTFTAANTQGTATSNWLYATVTYAGSSASSWSAYIAPQLYVSTGGYSGTVSSNPLSSATNLYLGQLSSSSGGYALNIYYNFARARAYPPSNVMPTVALGTITPPPFYVPITLTNNQASGTPNPFQVKITWNPSSYSVYETANLGNVRFYLDASLTTPLYAWIESCTPSLSNSASSATAWIKLTSSIAPSGGTLTIYMAFLSATTDFDNTYWGTAPNLSGTYGAYDNGANVFTFYDSFKGTSLNSTKWTTVKNSGGSVSVNNGITMTTSSSSDWAFVVSTLQTFPQVAETYLTSAGATTDPVLGVATTTSNNNGIELYNGYSIDSNGQTDTLSLSRQTSSADTSVNSRSITVINTGIWNITWSATGSESASDGTYTLTGSDSSISIANYRIYIGQSNTAAGSDAFRWARMRACPPNNAMPSAAFGGVSSPTLWVDSELWYLINPPTGSYQVTVNLSSGSAIATVATVTYSGVSQGSPIDGNTGTVNSSSSPSQNITVNTSNSLLLGNVALGPNTTVTSDGSGQTQRWDQTTSANYYGSTYVGRGHGSEKNSVSTGVQTMSWTLSQSISWAVSVVALKPAQTSNPATGNLSVDILIRQANGAVRSTIATDVANSASLSSTESTLNGTYAWSAYNVTSQTDYLEIDYYLDVTTAGSSNASLIIDNSSLALTNQTRAANIMLANQYIVQVEVTGAGSIQSGLSLLWTLDSSFTAANISTTLQLYNYNVSQYPSSGDGYLTYTSSSTPNTGETKSQSITLNPTFFLNSSSGAWKIRITGNSGSSFNLNLDWAEFKAVASNSFSLDITNSYACDQQDYPTAYIRGFEILLNYNVSDTNNTWLVKAYNWASSTFSNLNFNDTNGNHPAAVGAPWNYSLNITSNWANYVATNGTIILQLYSNTDTSQTTVSIDFFGVRALIIGSDFELKNSSPESVHIVSLWVTNSTLHQRFSADLFLNSGESTELIRADVSLPQGTFIAKVVTERGNAAIFSTG
jgi:hypothetical protein